MHSSVVFECLSTSNFLDKVWPSAMNQAAITGELTISPKVIQDSLDRSQSDCLISRKQRKKLEEAFLPLIDHVSNGAEKFVCSVLEFHRNSLAENSQFCRLGKFHDVLYVAATVAYKYDVQNGNLIGELLKAIYECEKSFDRLVAPAILGPKVSHILSSWRPDLDSTLEAQNFLLFFVLHSNALKLEFKDEYGLQYRLLDTPLLSLQGNSPLTVAVQTNGVTAVKFLLEYGAKIDLESWMSCLQKLSSAASNLLANYNCCNCRTINPSNEETNTIMSEQNLYNYLFPKIQTILKLDALPNHPDCCQRKLRIFIPWPEENIQILNFLKENSSFNNNSLLFHTQHPRIYQDGLVSRDPQSLKCLSRIAVRNTLTRTWNLPYGIPMLNLPPAMARLLTLEPE